jgi:hypothetical protein
MNNPVWEDKGVAARRFRILKRGHCPLFSLVPPHVNLRQNNLPVHRTGKASINEGRLNAIRCQLLHSGNGGYRHVGDAAQIAVNGVALAFPVMIPDRGTGAVLKRKLE